MFTKPTEKNIIDKFLKLIEENGEITTVEVKKALRKDGFWIFQSTVSNVLNEKYQELGIQRVTNGKFYTYRIIENEPEIENDADISTVNSDSDKKNQRGKLVSGPTLIDTAIYNMRIINNGASVELFVSDNDSLVGYGELVYEVRGISSGKWYLYSSDKNVIDRHKAIYYVWKVLNYENSDILYSELRSTKISK